MAKTLVLLLVEFDNKLVSICHLEVLVNAVSGAETTRYLSSSFSPNTMKFDMSFLTQVQVLT